MLVYHSDHSGWNWVTVNTESLDFFSFKPKPTEPLKADQVSARLQLAMAGKGHHMRPATVEISPRNFGMQRQRMRDSGGPSYS